MSVLDVVSLLGGLALFLYGVALMGDGLNRVAGDKLQLVLYRLTSSPVKGILLGVGVTALIQSSSAASIMVIGFVNSGLMELDQAISIILGSILGSSVTGWIVSLSSLGEASGWLDFLSTTFITGVLAVAGICLYKFSKDPRRNRVGTILLGFAVLMYGMSAMSDAVVSLRGSETFLSLLTSFSNPLLGILVGMVFTAVIQSSAAAVGILQALSMTGALSFAETFPILLGIAVGGALPVLMSALGASLNARRTALVHLIADVLGAAICGGVFYAANAVFSFAILDQAMSPVRVAALNTAFRLVTVLLLAPCIGLLERLARLFLPEKTGPAPAMSDWDLLEERFLRQPALAIEQSRIVIGEMAGHVRESIFIALGLLRDYSEEGYNDVVALEELADQYEDHLGSYLVKVTSSELNTKQNEDLYQFLHAITDFERISDHALNIAANAKELHEKSLRFSTHAIREMKVLRAAVEEVVDTAVRAFLTGDQETAHRVEPLEELIDLLCDEMKHRHVDRLQRGVCTLQNGFVFNDLLTNYERVSDHCSNIAVAMIELEHEAFDTHNYIESLTSRADRQFERYFAEYREKYSLGPAGTEDAP